MMKPFGFAQPDAEPKRLEGDTRVFVPANTALDRTMTEQLDPAAVEQVFARAGLSSSSVRAAPFLLIAPEPPAIRWANAAAVALFDAADEAEMSRRLFRSGPSSQALASRLQRMASGPEPRLERLMITRGFQIIPHVVACRGVEGAGAEALILLQFLSGPASQTAVETSFRSALSGESAVVPSAAPAAASDAEPASLGEVAGRLAAHFPEKRTLRVLWETDAAGHVTQVGRDFEAVVGEASLAVGDPIVTRLRLLGVGAAEEVEAALREHRTFSGTGFVWPLQGSRASVAVDIGWVYRSAPPGLRGFCLFHLDRLSERTETRDTHAPDAKPTQEPQAPAPVATPLDPVSDQSVGEMDHPGAPASEPVREGAPPESNATSAITDDASQRPAPPEAAALTGNVLHFPIVRFTSVPAAFGADVTQAHPNRPTQAPAEDAAPVLEPPLWSESPDGDQPSQLTSDEQDAFDHIRRVLGTRPFTEAKGEDVPAAADIDPTPQPSMGAPSWRNVDDPASPVDVLALLESLPGAFMLHRSNGVMQPNGALLQRLGYDDRDSFATAQALQERGGGGSGETKPALRAKDGTILEAEARTLTLDGEEATLLWLSSDQPSQPDQTAESLRRELDAMRVAAEQKEAALTLAADGVTFVDDGGLVRSVSPAIERLFGYAPASLVGRSAATLLMTDQEPMWQALLASAPDAATARPLSRDMLGRAREGGLVPVQIRVGRIAPNLLCVVWTDDSSRKRAANGLEAAKREAERVSTLKSEFLAKVSHEIRTPLNAILGFAEVIKDERLGPVGNSRYIEYLNDIHASGTHVMSLVNDLLDLSRIEAGRLDLKLEAVDANAIVNACVNTLQTQAHRERVIVRLSLASRLPPALADERSLRQIVLNLLSNAIKFNEPGGQVIVSTAMADSETLAIRIRDTGIGMSDDEIETAMEPFGQLPSPKSAGGSGLGLPLTKALVEANCASMAIKSTPGEGTLIEVVFPIVEPESLSVPAE